MIYSDYMARDRQLLNFIIENNLLTRVDDFRFQNRFPTRAGAIKWLLDWALQQGPNPAVSRPEISKKTPDVIAPPPPESAPPPSPSQAPETPASRPPPSHESVLEALKAQGYEVGETAVQDGQAVIVVRSTEGSALVTLGQELHDLAAGRLTLAKIVARRRHLGSR
jgi:hypothetical protein